MEKLRRLEVAEGYVGLLRDVDSLRLVFEWSWMICTDG